MSNKVMTLNNNIEQYMYDLNGRNEENSKLKLTI